MRVSFVARSVAGLAVALCLASPVSAAIIPITVPSATPTIETGSFTNYYTFTLATAKDLTAFDTITPLPSSTFDSGVLSLYKGVPTSGTLLSHTSLTGSPPSGTLMDDLTAGTYYYKVAVTASGELVNVLAVSGIPELQTWAMLGLGFAALGFVGFAKRRGESRALLD
jgi:hypothetical protein